MTIPPGELRSEHRPALFDALGTAWRGWRARVAQRAALRRAGRLGPRLVADMGLDPATIREASGGWDGLHPSGLLALTRG